MTPEEQTCYDRLRAENDTLRHRVSELKAELTAKDRFVKDAIEACSTAGARIAAADALLREVYEQRHRLRSVGLAYRIGHYLNHAHGSHAEANP